MQHAVSKMRRPDRVCGKHARGLKRMCAAGAGSNCAESGRTITRQRCRSTTADDYYEYNDLNDDENYNRADHNSRRLR
jgi:hypothetical protein